MRVLRGLAVLVLATALIFPGVPLVVDARTWCGTVLSVPVCKPVFGLLLTAFLVVPFLVVMREAKRFKNTAEPGVRTQCKKHVFLIFAKVAVLIIPLVAAYMVGVDWVFQKVNAKGIKALESLASLVTGAGFTVIFLAIIGADLIRLRQVKCDNEREN